MPMLASPGFEAANFYLLILGPGLFLAAACHNRYKDLNFYTIQMRELLWLLCHVFVNITLLLVRSFYSASCSEGAGLATHLVILVPALALNTTLGSLVACLIARRALKIVIWVFLYSSYYIYKLFYWWHDSPFRFLSHLSLLISSDLSQGQALSLALVAFRFATFLLVLALSALGLALWPLKGHSRRNYLILFVILLTSAVFIQQKSISSIGKRHTELAKDYSLIISTDFLYLHANPKLTTKEEAEAILDEARFYQEILEQRLESTVKKPIIIWLHKNDDEKFLYTGAKHVHFAQPDRREIHISQSVIPHPTLAHELAHIFIGEHSKTLWHVPGRLWLFPNFALTEGLAMLLSPELCISNNLTLKEQAQALHQAGLGIDIMELFSMNALLFFKSNFKASYIFSGAFLEFYLQSHPTNSADVIKFIAAAGSIGALFASKEELYKSIGLFMAYLAEPLDNYAISWAQKNFSSQGILLSTCNNEEQEKYNSWWTLIMNAHIQEALKILDSYDKDQQINLLVNAMKFFMHKEDFNNALKLALVAEKSMKNNSSIHDFYLDMSIIYLNLNNFNQSNLIINNINSNYLNPSRRREWLIIKELILEKNLLSEAIQALLFSPHRDSAYFAYNIGAYKGPQTLLSHMAHYLYARLLIQAHNYEEALLELEPLLSELLLPKVIAYEALIMKAESLVKIKNYDQAESVYKNLLDNIIYKSDMINFTHMINKINFMRRK
jgi:hypothetical protein